jgi:transcriptional regulator with XRE-family HTH domain
MDADELLPAAQEIADGLAAALKEKGLRQKDLAKAAGVSEGAVSGWIALDSDADLVQWRRLAAACRKLGLSADKILGVVPSENPGPGPRKVAAALRKLEEVRRLLAKPETTQAEERFGKVESGARNAKSRPMGAAKRGRR